MEISSQDKQILNRAKDDKLSKLKGKLNALYITGICSNDKRVKICSYLMHEIDPNLNLAIFNKRALAHRFNCSQMTVSRALNAMRKAKHIQVKGNTIRLIINKGGASDGE